MVTRAWHLLPVVALAAAAACDQSGSGGDTSSLTGAETDSGEGTSGLGTSGGDDTSCAFTKLSGECCAATNTLMLAPEVILLRAAVTIDGEAPPQSPYENGYIALRDPQSGATAVIGQTREGTLAAPVLRGTYQVVFEADQGGAIVPVNTRAVVVDRLDVVAPAPAEDAPEGALPALDATVPIVTTTVRGALQIDGKAPPLSVYDDARLWLLDTETDARTELAHTALDGGVFDKRVVPGAYEIRYQSVRKGAILPLNGDARLTSLTIADAPDLGPLAVTTTQVNAAITVDGAPPPASEYDNGALYLRDDVTDDLILAGETRDGAIIDLRVIASAPAGAASYATHYARRVSGALLPRNEWATLAAARPPSDLGPALDLETASLTASLKVDGATPAGTDRALLGLLGDGGDRAILGATSGAPITAPVLAGVYTAFYGHEQSTTALPANTRAPLTIPIDTAAQSDIEVSLSTLVLTGAITFNSAAPPTSAYDDGEVFLRGPSGDRVLLGHTRDGAYERRVIAGASYEICYAAASAGALAPRNGEACLDTVLDTAGQGPTLARDIDIPVAAVDIHLEAPLGTGVYDRGVLYLRHLISGDEVFIGTSDQQDFSVRVLPGPYEVVYRVDVAGATAPRNQGAALGCFVTAG